MSLRRVALIEGYRTPFVRAGTDFREMTAVDLGKAAVGELLHRTELPFAEVDEVAMGIALNKPSTTNLARLVALGIGLPTGVHCYHMQLACASSLLTTAHIALSIATGQADVGISGGAESLSDMPVTISEPLRKALMAAQALKRPEEQLAAITQVPLAHFLPQLPPIQESYTGYTMGEHTELMVQEWGITREAQDDYACRSHRLAAQAVADGRIPAEVALVFAPPEYAPVSRDNLVRANPDRAKLGALPPVFDKLVGTITAGNSSPLTDGGAALLLMSEEKAKALGYRPKAIVKAFAFSGVDLDLGMLFGPTYATPKALKKAGLTLSQIDLVEMHEAFAGQILCNLKAFTAKEWLERHLGLSEPIGEVNMDRFNVMGGSISLGHPFGATGARMLTTCANELARVDGTFGLVTACAANGTGGTVILERAA